MPTAWVCLAGHGTMLQSRILERQLRLIKRDPARNRRGCSTGHVEGSARPDAKQAPGYEHRIACPKCIRAGAPGYMRAATTEEIDALNARDGHQETQESRS